VPPKRGEIILADDAPSFEAIDQLDKKYIEFAESEKGRLRIWEEPDAGAAYLLCADSAAGLLSEDASCCSVLRLTPKSNGHIKMTLVAQLHGWINPLEYAAEIYKLGVLYNYGCVAIELTGGLGRAVMLRLKEMGYWNIFADLSQPEFTEAGESHRLGIDTNARTKPAMVGALQQAIKIGLLELKCENTVEELTSFEQERTDSGLTVRYRGAKGAHDDRVMSLAVGAYIVAAYPVIDFYNVIPEKHYKPTKEDETWGDVWQDIKDRLHQPRSPFE
jgi:hypothetical protein